MGRAAFPRFFFDANAGTCRRFTFGGLGGNGNNFRTFASCMASCAPVAAPTPLSPTHQERTIDCSQDPEPGLCMAYFPRFFHNATRYSNSQSPLQNHRSKSTLINTLPTLRVI